MLCVNPSHESNLLVVLCANSSPESHLLVVLSINPSHESYLLVMLLVFAVILMLAACFSLSLFSSLPIPYTQRLSQKALAATLTIPTLTVDKESVRFCAALQPKLRSIML